MNARLTATALALAWSGFILAGCSERPTEPLAAGTPVADVLVLNGVVLPTADAGADVQTYPHEAVELTGSAYDPAGRDIYSYEWVVESGPDGGDLFNAEFPTAYFTPNMPGDYFLTLTACVQGEFDLLCSAPDPVTVSVGNREPQASITAKPTTVTVGETVEFDGSGSYDPDQQDLTYSWNFGDGWISNNVSPSHAFADAGEYWVTLEVSDGWLTNYDEILITVEEEAGPRDGIVSLISGIHSLVTNGQLSADRGDGLLSKLNAALTSLDNGLTTDACKQLSAFEKQVAASIKARKLDAQIGQALIQASTSLRAGIGCA